MRCIILLKTKPKKFPKVNRYKKHIQTVCAKTKNELISLLKEKFR